jgi:hypothetical protein
MKLEVNLVRVCPYCKKRILKKKTCGNPLCQFEHHKKLMSGWWKGPGKIYNGKRR